MKGHQILELRIAQVVRIAQEEKLLTMTCLNKAYKI